MATLAAEVVVLAHAGEMHWYDYILYLVPLIVLGVMFLVDRVRRRGERVSGPPKPPRSRPKR